MAGEIKLNNVSIATENAGTVTINNATLGNSMVLGTNASPIANNLVFANGNGIDFSAAAGSAAGSSSALLDDYEKGTWTPAYTPSSGAFTTYTPNLNGGAYIKTGSLVCCTFILRTDVITVGTASGSVRLTGIPFSAGSGGLIACNISYANGFASNHPSAAYVSGNNNYAVLNARSTASGPFNNTLQVSDLGTGANANYIIGSLIYIIN